MPAWVEDDGCFLLQRTSCVCGLEELHAAEGVK
jgi:hypothetical protein